jgi:cytochrome d ubiquinol oxidase subunit II
LPALGLLSPLLAIVATKANKGGWAFLFTSLTIACVILTCGATMFPFVMPSSTFPDVSLTMWDATSSLFTLQVMTVVAIIFVPIVLLYTIWCYWKMHGRLDKKFIEGNNHTLY